MLFLPPDKETFQLISDLGIGWRFLNVAITDVSLEDVDRSPLFSSRFQSLGISLERWSVDNGGLLDEDCVERCGDWFLTASCVYGAEGQGILWEVFQQASLLNEQLQEFDPETPSFADYYHYCCQSMMKLLELFKRTVKRPLCVSAFHKSSRKTPQDQRRHR